MVFVSEVATAMGDIEVFPEAGAFVTEVFVSEEVAEASEGVEGGFWGFVFETSS